MKKGYIKEFTVYCEIFAEHHFETNIFASKLYYD